MKIATASLQMASTHVATQRHEISESLRAWVGDPPRDAGGRGIGRERVQLSEAGKAAGNNEGRPGEEDDEGVSKDPKLQMIRHMIELLTGVKIHVMDPRDLADPQKQAPAAENAASAQPAGYGVEYDYHESYSETEQTTFSVNGTVHTADGKQIDFKLNLAMARSFQVESQAALRLGDAARKKDPLVVNFGGTAAQLTDTRFAFDLDADGQAEQINGLAPGSGFLALDRNRDGKINNGSELFGAATGDGFAELAALDDDHNGWIDENDQAFQNLRIWTRSADGKDQLKTLAEAGVGALALAHVATPFDLKDTANQLLGQVRSTGVFLQENGGVGSLQQIDLTV